MMSRRIMKAVDRLHATLFIQVRFTAAEAKDILAELDFDADILTDCELKLRRHLTKHLDHMCQMNHTTKWEEEA